MPHNNFHVGEKFLKWRARGASRGHGVQSSAWRRNPFSIALASGHLAPAWVCHVITRLPVFILDGLSHRVGNSKKMVMVYHPSSPLWLHYFWKLAFTFTRVCWYPLLVLGPDHRRPHVVLLVQSGGKQCMAYGRHWYLFFSISSMLWWEIVLPSIWSFDMTKFSKIFPWNKCTFLLNSCLFFIKWLKIRVSLNHYCI